jgi:hypothetical protein
MRRNSISWRIYMANLGNNIALYLGAFMCCTIILIIPGIIFLLFWAVTKNDDKDETQYVEHHHHYEENKIINVDARDGRHTFKHTSKHDNFQGYLELK